MAASIQTTQISFYATVLSISLATLFFFKVNSTQTTSFSINRFVPNQPNLIFQGGAVASNDKLRLTPAVRSAIGRIVYSSPIHIWDRATGNVADFNTSFTFVINAAGTLNVADGLAFFVAPVDTTPQTRGEFLGVFNRLNSQSLRTVAVEFDTFYNPEWDPSTGDRHIGINVNSIRSKSTASWILRNRGQANVVISFTAATNVLNVRLTYPNGLSYTLSDVVPLKDAVPEWVRIGISATTGLEFAVQEILSWSFHSELRGTSRSNQAAAA